MRKVLMTLLIAAVMMSSGCKKAEDNTVITVDGTPITQKEVDTIIEKQMSSPFLAQFDKDSNEGKLLGLMAKEKAVNELIVKQIINNEIAKRDITISKEEIDEFKEDMIEDIGGEENLKELLSKNNMSEDEFKSTIAYDIQVSKLINTISPTSVSEAEVKKFYADNKASKFTYPDSVRASHILVKDKTKAEKVLKEAKVPNADFAALAKKYSEDTGSAANGGDLGFFAKDQMVKPFADAAFSLKPDEISDLVQSEFGYHIIKVVDRKKAGVMPYDEIESEIEKYLEDDKKVKVLQKFIDGQKSQIKVEYLNPEYDIENIKKEAIKLSPNLPQEDMAPVAKEEK